MGKRKADGRREQEELERRRWQRPRLTHLGRLNEIAAAGAGKLSVSMDGDGRKPPGQG